MRSWPPHSHSLGSCHRLASRVMTVHSAQPGCSQEWLLRSPALQRSLVVDSDLTMRRNGYNLMICGLVRLLIMDIRFLVTLAIIILLSLSLPQMESKRSQTLNYLSLSLPGQVSRGRPPLQDCSRATGRPQHSTSTPAIAPRNHIHCPLASSGYQPRFRQSCRRVTAWFFYSPIVWSAQFSFPNRSGTVHKRQYHWGLSWCFLQTLCLSVWCSPDRYCNIR